MNPLGQSWTTLDQMRRTHRNAFTRHEPGLIGIGTFPAFAIGQRALLLRTPGGNVLWDCISFIDDATIEIVQALGGVSAIAISHPHYYSSMVEWGRAFGATVWLHAADRQWVMRPDPCVQFWDTETRGIAPGATLIRAGGHFAGGTVLHWAAGADGSGALLSGDIVAGDAGQACQFHAQLSRPDPAGRKHGAAYRGRAGAMAVRSDLRRVVGPGDPVRRQGDAGLFGAAIYRRGEPATCGLNRLESSALAWE